ncbi:hypothetical protein CDL15_Pgr021081 [Punica granatum]|nr:hypothetical protein CDL15_Pgr021081 [Punica granatum]
MTTSSLGRVRVVRNPLNMMARLAKVVEGNGTSRRLSALGDPALGPDGLHERNMGLAASNRKTKLGNGLRG